jgi:hypothetical protein
MPYNMFNEYRATTNTPTNVSEYLTISIIADIVQLQDQSRLLN